MKLIPTIHLNGRCREALAAYQEAFGAQVTSLRTYRETGDAAYSHLSEMQQDSVYHAEMLLGGQRVNLCDDYDEPFAPSTATFLTLAFDSAGECSKAFELLQQGGRVITPLQSTWYADAMGALVDRFGVRWGLVAEKQW